MFFILSGRQDFRCGQQRFAAGPGDFVFCGRFPRTFLVGPDAPLHTLQSPRVGFEEFAAEVGGPAVERRLPDAGRPTPARWPPRRRGTPGDPRPPPPH